MRPKILEKLLPQQETVKEEKPKKIDFWSIDKSFSFCYGHRVWSQKLIGEFCESGDASCKCKHLHGHEGLVKIFLEAYELERGMVTDFKHLGWLKNFLDDNVDHKFIIDLNDPWFVNIVNLEPTYGADDDLLGFVARQPLNTVSTNILNAFSVYVPGTDHLAGWNVDTDGMSGPELEFFEGFFIVNFVPTSENLCKWLYDVVDAKMANLGVKVSGIDWSETPKSRATYFPM